MSLREELQALIHTCDETCDVDRREVGGCEYENEAADLAERLLSLVQTQIDTSIRAANADLCDALIGLFSHPVRSETGATQTKHLDLAVGLLAQATHQISKSLVEDRLEGKAGSILIGAEEATRFVLKTLVFLRNNHLMPPAPLAERAT